MGKQPKLMSLSRMRAIIEPHLSQVRENIFFNSELAILHGDPKVFQLILRQQPPFTINDHRLGFLAKGEIHANINLVEKHITAGSLVFIGPGTIISPIHFSDDLEVYGMGLSPDFPMPFAPGQFPSAFNGQVRDFQLKVSENDLTTTRHILDSIWHIVHQKDYYRPTLSAFVAALMHHYDALYREQAEQLASTRSREQTIFDRFIYLVNQHSQHEHRLAFYADKMCLTERYLGTVVRQASGTTAKEWLDRALVTRIKIELRHTDKSAAQIADEMNFPNPSFFSKYFKRLTGITPQTYRDSSS